jgi:succinate dehydrogenase / fumarate reductase cytochrome b subunit
MVFAASFLRSTIGKKIVMAVTGIILFGFLVGHMAGNLQVFLGAEVFDHYAASIKAMPPLLWGVRLVLLVSLVLHVWAALSLAARNRQSRPVGYRRHTPVSSSLPSRTMLISGLVILAFVIFHLLHFTIGPAHPSWPSFDPHTVYRNVVSGFSVWPVALGYVLVMLLLGWHLFHGVWSFFQTLGLNHPKYNLWRRRFAVVMTALVVAGFILVPLAVLGRIVR